jgi:hypothetical protein
VGHILLKVDQDQDAYVIWSSNVDAPIWHGTRALLYEYLWTEYRREHPTCQPFPGTGPDARLERTDILGTSDIDGDYGWEEEAFALRHGAPDDGYLYELPRANLSAYCQAIGRGPDDEAVALLRRGGRIDELDESQ